MWKKFFIYVFFYYLFLYLPVCDRALCSFTCVVCPYCNVGCHLNVTCIPCEYCSAGNHLYAHCVSCCHCITGHISQIAVLTRLAVTVYSGGHQGEALQQHHLQPVAREEDIQAGPDQCQGTKA